MGLVITYSLKLKFICSHVNALFPSADRQTLADFSKIASNSFLTKQGRETCVTQMFTRVAGFCPYQHLMAFIPKCSGCLGRVLACTARRSAVSYQNAWKFVIKTMKENLGDCFYNMFIAIYDQCKITS